MPDQEFEQRAYAASLLRKNYDKIKAMPPNRQKALYQLTFDKYVRPTLGRSGLSEEDMGTARDRWVQGLLAPSKEKPLGEAFGQEKDPKTGQAKHPRPAPFSAGVAGLMEGSASTISGMRDAASAISPKEKSLSDVVTGKQPTGISDRAKALSPGMAALDWLGEKADIAVDYWKKLGEGGGAPTAQAVGKFTGEALPGVLAFEGGAGLVPALEGAGAAPTAMKTLHYLARTLAGTATSTIPFGKTTPADVGKQTVANIAFDMLFRGIGKGGAKGASYLINKAKSSKVPSMAQAAAQVDDLFSTIMREKFPGKELKDLSPTEFDALTKETTLRREAEDAQKKAADKAVKDAKAAQAKKEKPKPLTPEQKARETIAKADARKAEAEKSKHMTTQFSEYKKRLGIVPPEGSDHAARIAAGETVDQILGKEAVQAATQKGEQKVGQILQEGAPTATEAVKTVQEATAPAGGEKRVTAGKAPEIERRKLHWRGVFGPTGGEEIERSLKETPSAITEANVYQWMMTQEPGKWSALKEMESQAQKMAKQAPTPEHAAKVIKDAERTIGQSFKDTQTRLDKMLKAGEVKIENGVISKVEKAKPAVKEKIAASAAKTAKPSMFKVDLTPIHKATTPEEFTSAKKDAIAEITAQAAAEAKKENLSHQDKLNIFSEANKEIQRIRSAEVPPTISKKAVDTKRVAAAKEAGREELLQQAKARERAVSDPEDKMLAQIQKSKDLEKWFKDNNQQGVYDQVAREYMKMKVDDTDTFIEMLEEAKEKLGNVTPKEDL